MLWVFSNWPVFLRPMNICVGQRKFETFEVSTLEHIVNGLYPAIQTEPASGTKFTW